jgi:RND superfamily putative drug exporter
LAPLKQDTHGTASPPTYRLGFAYGRGLYRIRWLVLAVWAVAVVVSVPFASKLSGALSGGGYTYGNSDSVRVQSIAVDQLHFPPAQVQVVFQSGSVPASDPSYQDEVTRVSNKLWALPHVTQVTSGGVGTDGRTTYLTVSFDKNPDIPTLRKLLPNGAVASPARVYLTGDLAVYDEFSSIAETDVGRADATALPLALLVLLVVFGTVVAALTPLLLALVALPVALALLYGYAMHNTTNVAVLSIASIVGLGLSIDYSLLMVRRFREELARGRAVPDAVGWTVATAGEAILFSGLTVLVGFAGLTLLGVQTMTSFGVGGAAVVAAAMLAALTLLPALLGVLGPRLNALRLPLLSRLTLPRDAGADGSERPGFWHTLALGVMRRPVLILALVVAFLLALGWPVVDISLGLPSVDSLPKSAEARQGNDILMAQFPQTAQNPILIIAQTPDGSSMLSPDNLARLAHLSDWIASQRHVSAVTSLMRLPEAAPAGQPALSEQQLIALYTSGAYQQSPALARLVAATTAQGTTLITATDDTRLDSPEGKALVDHLRAGDQAQGEGLTVLVGGLQAVASDFNRYLYANFPRAILFIVATTYILLLLMFRSVLLPLKAVLMNVLSISAAFGVLVFVFQWGHFQQLLGFTSEGFIESTGPVVMFCVLFGLSMDYEVFLLSRIREEWLRTQRNTQAVALGLEKTGGVITNAALIFVIVSGAIAFTSLISTKEIGLGMAVAVLVDATVIRTLLVPATMRLLGRWNWWLPGRPLPPPQVENRA